MFSTVLIANRGEIALRVARTCREMGIRTVGVSSTSDLESPVARFVDECIHIGPPAARKSYLNAAAVVEAALRSKADAVHPGYGFLSEDPLFAEICEAEGLTFIGPSADLLQKMGDKSLAKDLAAAAGMPVLPGTPGTMETFAQAERAAEEIGYPIMLKAASGGGGRGITMVTERAALFRAYEEARSHALAIFGDPRIYVERCLQGVRHVEVQVLGDRHGNVVHLGARDCSVQRRRQKLIEETPPPGLEPQLVEAICQSAVQGARYAGYEGAGTFEFLVDRHDNFYFMELNCRIQVEHPVTEMVTGIDLVREQILVAAGRRLGFGQDDVRLRGAAMECRINAEDADQDFRPTPGLIEDFHAPGGPFTRVDAAIESGMRLSPDYDPMLAKVIVWAPDREQVLARMDRALGELRVRGPGVSTSAGFLRDVLRHPDFRAGRHGETLVPEMMAERAAARER